MCNLDIFTTQALAYWKPKEHNEPFSTEPCVTLAYSELEAYLWYCETSEHFHISIMDNFVQDHV